MKDGAGYTQLPQKGNENVKEHLNDVHVSVGHHALKANTYDAVTWALAKMGDPTLVATKGKVHLTIAFAIPCVLHIITTLLQVGAIFGLLQFTIARSEDKYTTGSEDQRASIAILQNAIANGTALDKTIHHHLLTMCEKDHNVPYSQSVMTWLWGMKLLPVISQSVWVMVLVMRMPRAKAGEHWISKDEKDHHLDICKMGLPSKIFCVLFVDLPRVFIALYLYWMGAKFLMYAKSLGVLIMKSIGLGFIATLPDIIFAGAFSEAFQKEMARVKLLFHANDEEDGGAACVGLDNWNLWGAPLVKVGSILLISLYYCRILCGDLQDLRAACLSYKYKFILPECPTCGSHFFGLTLYN